MKALPGFLVAFVALFAVDAAGNWNFPPPHPPEEYGNILINRTSDRNKVKPVGFSHWMHRRKHTCRVCHFELEFSMKTGATEITEEGNQSGRYCGACHDGNSLFGHTPVNCEKCHNGEIGYGNQRFYNMWRFPKTRYGNQIDWCLALEEKWIEPVRFLSTPPMPDEVIEKKVELEAEWGAVPPAVFPHRKHSIWLDCNNCHPEVFRIRQKATGFQMAQVLKGEFCGLCHGSVAFPLTDCVRCHPRMKSVPVYQEPVSK